LLRFECIATDQWRALDELGVGEGDVFEAAGVGGVGVVGEGVGVVVIGIVRNVGAGVRIVVVV
jgi:hypothetical protein